MRWTPAHLGRRPAGTDVTATSLHTLVEMAANGLGVTLIPDMALQAKLLKGSELVARPFPGGKPGRRIGLIWRKTSAREKGVPAAGADHQGRVISRRPSEAVAISRSSSRDLVPGSTPSFFAPQGVDPGA